LIFWLTKGREEGIMKADHPNAKDLTTTVVGSKGVEYETENMALPAACSFDDRKLCGLQSAHGGYAR
jgi:hypothetical protein